MKTKVVLESRGDPTLLEIEAKALIKYLGEAP